MAWKFNNDTPIYLQIVEEIKLQIAKGQLKAGEQIPSVRDLAVTAGVNPNTMQKALAELEREGVLYSQRTSGRFVADSSESVTTMRDEMSGKYVGGFVSSMRGLGYTDEGIVAAVERYIKEEQNE